MIKSLYNKNDKRFIFFTGEELASNKKKANLEDYLNKIPQFQFLPSFRGIPKPEVFLHKFKNQQGNIIYYCHSGLWKTVADWCKSNNVVFEAPDREFYRTDFKLTLEEFIEYVKSWNLNLNPYDYQYKAAWLILKYRQSLSQLATRAGKTLIAYMVFRYMLENGAHNILMVVPNTSLVKQAVADMKEYKEFFKSETVWSGGELCEGSNLTVGTFQSLVKRADKRSSKYNPKFFNKYDIVLVDEAHTLKCESINKILNQEFMKNVKLQFGFSGSLPEEHTIDSFCCHSLMGPIIQDIRSKELVDQGFLAEPHITQIRINYDWDEKLTKDYIECGEYLNSNVVKENGKNVSLSKEEQSFTMKEKKTLPPVLRQLRQLYNDREYIDYLVDLCKAKGSNLLLLEQMLVHRSQKRLDVMRRLLDKMDKNCIVFGHHQEYLRFLKEYFEKIYPDRPIYIIQGNTSVKKRDTIIKNMLGDKNAILFASYGCCSTGLTFKNVDYGIFAQSFKSQIINKQSIGRLMLKNSQKDNFELYDLVDCFPTRKLEMQGVAKAKLYKKEKIEFDIEYK
jgi:superfamily II DNA or RNA helicase